MRLTRCLALSLEESKIHKADTIRHRQNLKSGREGRAGQPLDVQENWDQGKHKATGSWNQGAEGTELSFGAQADKGLGLGSGLDNEVEKERPSTSPSSRPVARADSEELVMKACFPPIRTPGASLDQENRALEREPKAYPSGPAHFRSL